jgi:hypothetical protein
MGLAGAHEMGIWNFQFLLTSQFIQNAKGIFDRCTLRVATCSHHDAPRSGTPSRQRPSKGDRHLASSTIFSLSVD